MIPSLSKLTIHDDASVKCDEPAKIGMDPSQDNDMLGLTVLADVAAARGMEEQIAAIRREIAQVYDELKSYQINLHNLPLPEGLEELRSSISSISDHASTEMWNALTDRQRIFHKHMVEAPPNRPVLLYLLQIWRWFLKKLPQKMATTSGPLTNAKVYKLWADIVTHVLDGKLASHLDKKIQSDDRTDKTRKNYKDLVLLAAFFQYVKRNILNIQFKDSASSTWSALTPRLVAAMNRTKIYIRNKFGHLSVAFEIKDVGRVGSGRQVF